MLHWCWFTDVDDDVVAICFIHAYELHGLGAFSIYTCAKFSFFFLLPFGSAWFRLFIFIVTVVVIVIFIIWVLFGVIYLSIWHCSKIVASQIKSCREKCAVIYAIVSSVCICRLLQYNFIYIYMYTMYTFESSLLIPWSE